MNKVALRQQLRAARDQLSAEERQAYNHAITRHCIDFIADRKLQHVGVYLAQNGEVDLSAVVQYLWQTHRKCYLPVLSENKILRFAPYRLNSEMKPNRFNIPEPTETSVSASELQLILAPLVGFDADGNRLGMGGGFYDATLKNLASRPQFIGSAYSLQQCTSLPKDPWDMQLDGIVTELGLRLLK